jgi:hypothetical protein
VPVALTRLSSCSNTGRGQSVQGLRLRGQASGRHAAAGARRETGGHRQGARSRAGGSLPAAGRPALPLPCSLGRLHQHQRLAGCLPLSWVTALTQHH